MLAKQQNVVQNQAQKPNLKVVSIKPPVKSGQQCLAEIRAQLDSKLRNPAHIFDDKITPEQRKILCFAAGLKRSDLELTFNQLNAESRQAIRKALFMCRDIFNSFNQASAIATKKFYLPGEATLTNYNGEFNPSNKLVAQEIQ